MSVLSATSASQLSLISATLVLKFLLKFLNDRADLYTALMDTPPT